MIISHAPCDLGLVSDPRLGVEIAVWQLWANPIMPGIAAANGVEAAAAGAARFPFESLMHLTGPKRVWQDDPSRCRGHRHGSVWNIGDEWLFESVSHKFHACCHGLHAALEAARNLDIAEPEVAELKIKTHPRWMSVCNQTAADHVVWVRSFPIVRWSRCRRLGYDTALPGSYSDKICADPQGCSPLARSDHGRSG